MTPPPPQYRPLTKTGVFFKLGFFFKLGVFQKFQDFSEGRFLNWGFFLNWVFFKLGVFRDFSARISEGQTPSFRERSVPRNSNRIP